MTISDKIRSMGLKVTPQRQMIYEIMHDLSHAPIEQIIERVQQDDKQTTISTIYRIINSFCENNLLAKVNHPNGKIYYDINTHEHHHIFSAKQTLIDIDDEELTEFIRERIADKIAPEELLESISIQITTTLKDTTNN